MDVVFETLVFLAVGLLAITITVFVLAVSLLGRAVKISLEEQEKAEKERKDENEKEIAKIESELNQAKTEERYLDIKTLGKSLRDFKNIDKKHDHRLMWIRWKPRFLRANWGAIIPSAFFLISIFPSVLARYHLSQTPGASVSMYLWITLFIMAVGIFFVCIVLKIIEGVAITSEETASLREKEVLKSALVEIEEAKRPALIFEFRGEQPPFYVKAESEVTIRCAVVLIKGYNAKNTVAVFWAPPDFRFLNPSAKIELAGHQNYDSYKVNLEDISRTIKRWLDIRLTAASKPGHYTMYHKLYCDDFYSELREFEIVVEESELPY